MENYKIYQSDLIKDNYQLFINQCGFVSDLIIKNLNTTDTTWSFDKYNIFSITSSSILFYKLYKELNYHIRSFIKDDRPLWIQSWLNYHKGEEVEKKLHPHGHGGQYHGYISINPQDTTTIFKNGLQIHNKIGQIYIGPGNGGDPTDKEWNHYVKINKPYNGIRITLGFDISSKPDTFLNSFFIPLL